jgi:hypothetical protein
MPQPNDFLVKRDTQKPAEEAVFTYFGPYGATERFRFLVLKEAGAFISVLPGRDGRFKTGLRALRWETAEGGKPTTYVVVKTRPNRIDLRRLPEGAQAATEQE